MSTGEAWEPSDGGLQAWLVVFASFLVNGLVFGVINSYSVIYFQLQKDLEESGVAESSSKASLVGSLTIGATFALSIVAGVLTDRLGLQKTALVGGSLAVLGMLLSSVLADQVEALYFTYGILFGLGASLAYTPSLAILGLHFRRRMGFVNGLVTAGSSVFTIVLPPILGALLAWSGVEGVLRALALAMCFLLVAAMLFKVPEGYVKPKRSSDGGGFHVSDFINVEIWKKRRYVIWALALPTALFGYFVPYVHMVKFVSIQFPGEDGKLLVMCIGVTSGVGRLIFGKLADMPRVDRILLQQISFISIGILTMLLTVAPAWGFMVAIALGMGLFDGCFISLIGPIAFDLVGPDNASQAIGFLLGIFSIPLTIGPPLAGMMFDHLHSYFWPFLLSGCPPIIGALLLFAVRCVPSDTPETQVKGSKEEQHGLEAGTHNASSVPTGFTDSRTQSGPKTTGDESASLLSGGGGGGAGGGQLPHYVQRESSC